MKIQNLIKMLHKPVHPIVTASVIVVVVLLAAILLLTKYAGNRSSTRQPTIAYSTPTATLTPMPVDTSTWKTYTDWKYGYSVKLPPEFAGYRPTKGYTGDNPDPDGSGMMQFEDTTLSGDYPNRTSKYGFSISLAEIVNPDSTYSKCITDQECFNLLNNLYHNTPGGMRVTPIHAQIFNKDIKGLAVQTPSGTGTEGKDISIYYYYNLVENNKPFSIVINFYYPKSFQQVQTKDPVINAILSSISFTNQ